MQFLVTKELKRNRLLTLIVVVLMATFTIFLLLDMILYHYQIGLSLEKATETLLGNEEAFIEPLLFDIVLERVHVGIFTSMITLILLSIIYMRIHAIHTSKVIHLAFISAILAPIALLLAYFYGTVFILAWIALFVVWHLCAFYLSANSLWNLMR